MKQLLPVAIFLVLYASAVEADLLTGDIPRANHPMLARIFLHRHDPV
ncbi:MAG TPA: hypothetical protein VI958_00640 [Acidobacteriota bacterium]